MLLALFIASAASAKQPRAWALVDYDGTVIKCKRCDVANTYQETRGVYVVGFKTPVRKRPMIASPYYIDTADVPDKRRYVGALLHPVERDRYSIRIESFNVYLIDWFDIGFTVIIY